MILQRFILIIAFIWGAAAAQATTLDSVVAVTGGPTITDNIGTVSVSPFGVSYLGSPTASSSTGDIIGILQADFAGQNTLFIASSTPTLGPPPTFTFTPPVNLLLGTVIDFADGAGVIQALFQTTGGTLASQFGGLFRLTLSSVSFSDTTLDDAQVSPLVTGAAATVEAVNVIPLPAGLWLMLGALGGLLTLRRRARNCVPA